MLGEPGLVSVALVVSVAHVDTCRGELVFGCRGSGITSCARKDSSNIYYVPGLSEAQAQRLLSEAPASICRVSLRGLLVGNLALGR